MIYAVLPFLCCIKEETNQGKLKQTMPTLRRANTMQPRKTRREKLRAKIQGREGGFIALKTLWYVPVIMPLMIFCMTSNSHASFAVRYMFALSAGLFMFGAIYGMKVSSHLSLGGIGRHFISDATSEEVPELLILTRYTKGRTQIQAREKLLTILFRLTEDDGALLDDQAQINLVFFVTKQDNELVSVTLGALEEVGNARSLPSVRALSQGKYLAATDPDLQEAATFSLARIEERLERIKRGNELLRPSVVPLKPETLLRPTLPPTLEEPQVLLRSGEKPE